MSCSQYEGRLVQVTPLTFTVRSVCKWILFSNTSTVLLSCYFILCSLPVIVGSETKAANWLCIMKRHNPPCVKWCYSWVSDSCFSDWAFSLTWSHGANCAWQVCRCITAHSTDSGSVPSLPVSTPLLHASVICPPACLTLGVCLFLKKQKNNKI